MANDGGTCHNEVKLSSNYQASRPIVKHHEGAECRLFRWETTWKERKVLNLHKNNEQLACIKQQEEWNAMNILRSISMAISSDLFFNFNLTFKRKLGIQFLNHHLLSDIQIVNCVNIVRDVSIPSVSLSELHSLVAVANCWYILYRSIQYHSHNLGTRNNWRLEIDGAFPSSSHLFLRGSSLP